RRESDELSDPAVKIDRMVRVQGMINREIREHRPLLRSRNGENRFDAGLDARILRELARDESAHRMPKDHDIPVSAAAALFLMHQNLLRTFVLALFNGASVVVRGRWTYKVVDPLLAQRALICAEIMSAKNRRNVFNVDLR